MLPFRDMGFFSPLDKKLRGRKILRQFSKGLLGKQKVKVKQGTSPRRRGPGNW
jgi:hypothetical protein